MMPSVRVLRDSGRLGVVHRDGSETWTSQDVYAVGHPPTRVEENVWRVYRDQFEIQRVIPESWVAKCYAGRGGTA